MVFRLQLRKIDIVLPKLPKLIVLLGPTASGKTAWGLEIAAAFDADIISADSRQVYQKMNIGTAKAPGEWRWDGLGRTYFVNNIRHYLVDFLNPGKTFSAAEFRDEAIKDIKTIYKNGRVPLVVGGTGLYISTLVDNFMIPPVEANPKLRKSLEEKTKEELFELLEKMDKGTAAVIDKHNKRRLIRALEVCIMTGESFLSQKKKGEAQFEVLQIGIDIDRDLLHARIDERCQKMVDEGLIGEIEKLLKQKYAWTLSSMNGIGYRQFKPYFEGQIDLQQAIEQLKLDTWHYARRQLTWFRRDKRINWVKTVGDAKDLIRNFLAE